jgi:hypothetical protein
MYCRANERMNARAAEQLDSSILRIQ